MKNYILLFSVILFACSFQSCKKDKVDLCSNITCNDNGSCTDGTCDCDPGFSGPNCSVADLCYNKTCNDNGTCTDGTCDCDTGFSGPNCSIIDGTTGGNVLCKIDGVEWVPDLIRIRLINGIISIQGQRTTELDALTITVDDQAIGTYNFLIGSAHSASYLPEASQNAYLTGISALATGSIEITKLDVPNKKLSATFQFNAYRTDGSFVQITEGTLIDQDIE